MAKPNDSRSPLSIGLDWSSRVTTIGLEFVLPLLLGAWIDRRVGTTPWLALLGMGLGSFAAFVHLLRMTRQPPGL